MKKFGFKLLAGLLVAVLVLSVFLPMKNRASAYALDTYEIYFEDIDDIFTYEQSQSIEKSMQTAANAARCSLGIYAVNNVSDYTSVTEPSLDALLDVFQGDAIVIVYYQNTINDPPEYFHAFAAKGNIGGYTENQYELSNLLDDTAKEKGGEAGIKAFCEKLTEYGEAFYSSYNFQIKDEYQNSSDELLIRGGKWKAALADYDDCLTPAQEENVLDLMEETAEKVKCNVGIVITRDLDGKSDVGYIRAFSDDVFGHGSDSITLLLLNAHGNPAYAGYEDQLDRTGAAYKFDKYVDKIYNELYYALDKNGASSVQHFDSACIAFCDSVKTYGSFSFSRFLLVFVHNPGPVLLALVFGFMTSLIVTSATVSNYKKKKPISAAQYIDRRTVNVTFRRDDFIREYTTSVHIDRNSHHHGGHRGGGHHSSGGGHHTSGGRHR